jgi:hypothetical protein
VILETKQGMYPFSDKNFDDKIAYEEFYSWWDAADAYGTRNNMSV